MNKRILIISIILMSCGLVLISVVLHAVYMSRAHAAFDDLRSRYDVVVAEGAGHTGALQAHPVEWEQRVTDFLDGAIGPAAD